MKKILLSIFSLATIYSQAQILDDYAVAATPTSVSAGQSSNIELSNSQAGVLYSLRNSSNTIIGASQIGTGSALNFNTEAISATETYNINAQSVNSVGLKFSLFVEHFTANVPTGLNYNTGYTFEGWVKGGLPGNSFYSTIFTIESATSSDVEIYTQSGAFNGGNNYMTIVHNRSNAGSFSVSQFASPPDNVWYHLAVVFDGTNLEVFYNGVSQGVSSTIPPVETASAAITIGSINNSAWTSGVPSGHNSGFLGQLDDIRLWSTARTVAQITANMKECLSGTETGLKAFYNCNNGTGTGATVADAVAGNDGTLQNYPTVSDAWVIVEAAVVPCNADAGRIIRFDTYNQHLTANVPSGLNYNTAYTVEGWVKGELPGANFYSTIFAIENVISSDVEIYTQSVSNLMTIVHNRGNAGSQSVRQFASPPNNLWYHLAVVFDGTNVEVFYNGVAQGGGPITPPVETASAAITIGSINNNSWTGGLPSGQGSGFLGNLDELRVWSTAKTSAQIIDNMNVCLPGTQTGLEAFYKFDEKSGAAASDEIGNADATLQNMNNNAWQANNAAIVHCPDLSGASFSVNLTMTQTATVTVTTVGVNESSQNLPLRIYPNPTKNNLTIDTKELKIQNITILDITGKTVKTVTSSNNTINVADLIKGIYFIQIQTEKGMVNSKFIKE